MMINQRIYLEAFMDKTIVPVLLGADLNCYSVARAFHEAYGVCSCAFGKYPLGTTQYSRIVKFTSVPNLEQSDVLCQTLFEFAKKHKGKELYLIACTDEYQEALIKNQEFLSKYYFCVCPKEELAKSIISKEAFYKICKMHSLSHPRTEIFYKHSDTEFLERISFDYPIIIKPSSSIEYWRTPFEGMKKVYTAKSKEEAKKIISEIFASGYSNSIILQEFIKGEDYVVTTYSDKNSKVCALCMGKVLLGEHTPKGLGNHVAILTERDEETEKKLISFLENIGYTGFANFDIIKDERNGDFKILEMNLRQGRSNYYLTSSGVNIAELPVKDRRNLFENISILHSKENFWHTVPKQIIYKYITDENTKKAAKKLVSAKKSASTLFYQKDICANPLRAAYVFIHNIRYYRKFRIYG
jgi:D-aspartate ligase